jgi:hypothetical protein
MVLTTRLCSTGKGLLLLVGFLLIGSASGLGVTARFRSPRTETTSYHFIRSSKNNAASTMSSYLKGASDDRDENDNDFSLTTKESDQIVFGGVGSVASLIMLYSEYVLSETGCGLPAGPLGLVGALEGLSYLTVLSLGSYSIYTKVKTVGQYKPHCLEAIYNVSFILYLSTKFIPQLKGSGLPAGKFGLLGLAEGLAFVALVAGVIVLALQITNFGYIPNAVPMEGGMCQ